MPKPNAIRQVLKDPRRPDPAELATMRHALQHALYTVAEQELGGNPCVLAEQYGLKPLNLYSLRNFNDIKLSTFIAIAAMAGQQVLLAPQPEGEVEIAYKYKPVAEDVRDGLINKVTEQLYDKYEAAELEIIMQEVRRAVAARAKYLQKSAKTL